MEGRPLASILSAGGRVFYQTHLFPALKMQGKVEEIYLSLRSRSNDEIPVLLNGVRRERGEGVAAIVVNECILITMRQRDRFENEILRAKKAAEEAARAREEAYAALAEASAEEARLRIRERRIAEVLQNALRPAISDNIPGLSVHTFYHPALDEAEVGGDFFDVFSIEKGCYALVVADLSGKGLTAASQVATVRHMLRALLYRRDLTVAQAVTSLNDMLSEHNLLEGFATLFVGAYDTDRHTLTYVNAGQEPGLILRGSVGRMDVLAPTGPVLGGIAGAAFRQDAVPLDSGDVLALFTDGLTEAGPSRKEMLEVEGIASIFKEAAADAPNPAPPGEIATRMMASVEAIATPAGMRDDICLLVTCVD